MPLIANASVTIDASAERVWQALVSPDAIKQYMFGATVVTDWHEGSPIVWKGEWKGKPYEDKGVVLRVVPGEALQYSHFSPMSGLEDAPENYHTIRIGLFGDGKRTAVSLTQDNNPTESMRYESEKNWNAMLAALKKVVEA